MLAQLDRELVVLKPVKMKIREIAAILLVDRLRGSVGLKTPPPTLHMSFTGNPGTGKRPSPFGWPRSCTGWATSGRGTSSP
ncbi:hypothetical protein AB1399_09735, partial [Hydrogenibacillus schlegelii]